MKKLLKIILITILLTSPVYSAGSSGNDNGTDSKIKANTPFYSATTRIKKAKKLEKKGKIEKATIQYEKALKYLLKSNKEKPNKADTLNYLGFASRKLGNFEVAEKYYLDGLKIKPNHNGINEYLGELYISTNRIELAKERLEILRNCKCEEYAELKELIENN